MFVCRSHRTNTSCIRGSYTTWTNMYVWRHNHQTQRVFPDVMTSEYNPSETWAAILTRSTSDLSVLSRNSERLLPGHTCSRCVCWFNLSAHSDRRLISQLWRRSISQSEDFNLSLTSEADRFTCLTSPEPEPSGCNMILNNGAVWWRQESQNELKMFEIEQIINYSVNNTDLKGAVHPKLTVQSSSLWSTTESIHWYICDRTMSSAHRHVAPDVIHILFTAELFTAAAEIKVLACTPTEVYVTSPQIRLWSVLFCRPTSFLLLLASDWI